MEYKDYIETTIVLYGDFDIQDNSQWEEWLRSMNGYMEKLCCPPTHFAVHSKNIFTTLQIIPIREYHKKTDRAFLDDNGINHMELMQLPDEFEFAMYDYVARGCRIKDRIMDEANIHLSLPNDLFLKIDQDEFIEKQKKYITFRHGEIFTLSNDEQPFFYVTGLKDEEDFETLSVIKRF